MTYLVTGAAGFIGFHVCKALLDRGIDDVIGVDQIDSYYDPNLKRARLAILEKHSNFSFHQLDIADRERMELLATQHPDITNIIHLAAQAGVRYSVINPYAYTRSNVEGHLVVLEMARNLKHCEHLVYASSSSVYGANDKLPFSVEDRVDNPISLYAATKKSCELMAHCYSHLYRIPTTGLRFFTVYGPWGRPDMAAFLFVKAVLDRKPISVFNNGDLKRDFTYVDDIVAGVLSVTDNPPTKATTPYRIYNIGNNRPESIMHFIKIIEDATGVTAIVNYEAMQPGDVKETFSDIGPITSDFGFKPKMTIEEGLPLFVAWYREYYNV